MALERQHGRPIFVCDAGCGGDFEGDGAEDACPAFWDAFVQAAKANGWMITKDGSEPKHFCPDCKMNQPYIE